MTQIFSPAGDVLPVTEIKVEPVTVTQIKTKTTDGYEAVQVGSGSKRKLTKSVLGHLQGKKFRHIKEFRMPIDDLEVGDGWGIEIFSEGDKARITGISKGKGFQGVVKRWGFHGSPATHGHKDQLRMPGSIGATGPARVFKGKKMPGHMGAQQTTTKWLEIVKIDKENNIISVKGAVPGARNGVIYLSAQGEFDLESKQAKIEESSEKKVAEEAPAIADVKGSQEEKPAEKKEDKQKSEIKEK